MDLYFEGGFEFGYYLFADERGGAKSEIKAFETNRDRKIIELDVRSRIQIGILNGKIGGYIGYA